MGGVPSPSPATPQGDMDMDMDMDSPRANPVSYQRQSQQQYQQLQQPSPEATPQPTPQRLSPSPPSPPHSHDTRASPPPQQPLALPDSYEEPLDAGKVAAALETARDSPEGAQDPEVSGVLEAALSQIWDRVLAQPDRYIMTKGEFAVFNLYQHLFLGDRLATAARRRFWDNTHG